ncbi:MAG: ABC transporter permease subunit [Geminicoccaceae bacterium]
MAPRRVLGVPKDEAEQRAMALPMSARSTVPASVSIHKGQLEASLSLGMTPIKAMRFIVLPQAVRIMLPPLCNYAILLVKDTAIISTIAAPVSSIEARSAIPPAVIVMDLPLTRKGRLP